MEKPTTTFPVRQRIIGSLILGSAFVPPLLYIAAAPEPQIPMIFLIVFGCTAVIKSIPMFS